LKRILVYNKSSKLKSKQKEVSHPTVSHQSSLLHSFTDWQQSIVSIRCSTKAIVPALWQLVYYTVIH